MLVVVDCGGGGRMMMMMMMYVCILHSFVSIVLVLLWLQRTTYSIRIRPRGSSDCAHARPVNLLKLCSQFAHVGEQSLSKS
jgi:hypothetical protein